jgi:hypothetical protein
MHVRTLALGLLLFAACSPAVAEEERERPAPPTRADVERALATEERDDAHRLAQWGDAVVPLLVEVAKDRDTTLSSKSTGRIPGVLHRIGTETAASAFVEILRGRTGIGTHWAMSQILHFPSPKAFLDHLRGREDLKEHAARELEGRFLDQDWIEVVAMLGWKDLVPQLRTVFEDGDFRAREKAADAILRLTGTRPVVERPAPVFPKTNLSEGLVGPARRLPGIWWNDSDHVTHVRWFDGSWRLVEMWDGKAFLRASADVARPGQRFPLPAPAHHAATVSMDGAMRLLAFVGRSQEWGLSPERFVVLDAAGETLGSTDAGDEYWHPRGVLLASGKGPYGWAVTAGPAGNELVVFGLDGRVRSRQAWPLLTSLSVHPSLPGWLLATAGEPSLHLHTPERIEEGIDIETCSRRTAYCCPMRKVVPPVCSEGLRAHRSVANVRHRTRTTFLPVSSSAATTSERSRGARRSRGTWTGWSSSNPTTLHG